METSAYSRKALFNRLKSQIHENYEVDFVPRESKTLVIIFSPHAKHALRKHPFKYDCLYVSDKKLFFYLYNPGRQSLAIQGFIERGGYERAIFLGSSKGGAGALLWSSLVFRRSVGFRIYCMAFSPQTKLFPYNENLTSLPSYLGNLKEMRRNKAHRVNFEAHGNIPWFIKDKTPPTLVAYSAKYKMDVVEALWLKDNPAVHLAPIDLAFHGSITAFVTDLHNAEQVNKLATKLYTDADRDADLKSSLPTRMEDFAAMFSNLNCPTLNDYIDQFCGQI